MRERRHLGAIKPYEFTWLIHEESRRTCGGWRTEDGNGGRRGGTVVWKSEERLMRKEKMQSGMFVMCCGQDQSTGLSFSAEDLSWALQGMPTVACKEVTYGKRMEWVSLSHMESAHFKMFRIRTVIILLGLIMP
jgi:hypothetical protein